MRQELWLYEQQHEASGSHNNEPGQGVDTDRYAQPRAQQRQAQSRQHLPAPVEPIEHRP
jgi:hypothetical protein